MNSPTTRKLLERALTHSIILTDLSYVEAHAIRARLYSARQRARSRGQHQFDSIVFHISQGASSWELLIHTPKPLQIREERNHV